jgi:hypothetical protein
MTMTLAWPVVLAVLSSIAASQLHRTMRAWRRLPQTPARLLNEELTATELALSDELQGRFARIAWRGLGLLPSVATTVHVVAALTSLTLLRQRFAAPANAGSLWPSGWMVATVVLLLVTSTWSLTASARLFVAYRGFALALRTLLTSESVEVTTGPPRHMRHEWPVFVSCKTLDDAGQPTRDVSIAERVVADLASQGTRAFFGLQSLETLGASDYKRAIDDALEQAEVLVVVGTTPRHLASGWVRYEWDSFLNEVLSGLKPDGRLFVLVEGLSPRELPRPLRQVQVFQYPGELERLYAYIRAKPTVTGASVALPG